jgi:hypothetical protein
MASGFWKDNINIKHHYHHHHPGLRRNLSIGSDAGRTYRTRYDNRKPTKLPKQTLNTIRLDPNKSIKQ